MKKILTISIAAYNVEKYIDKVLKSVLIKDMDKLEILVQDDGSKDNTNIIAKKYEEMYPNSIKVVKKENGGYGSTINNSIKIATGKYFKQLDGDDWYNTENLENLIKELEKIDVDAVYNPYYKYFEGNKKIEIIDDFASVKIGKYEFEKISGEINKKNFRPLMMHSLIFKTSLLKENNIHCLEKCFYTDTEYVIYPLMHVKDIYISKLAIYYYRIGRKDQSMSIENRKKNYKDNLKVSKRLLEESSKPFFNEEYISSYICTIFGNTVGGILLILPLSYKNLNQIKEFELEIKEKNNKLYENMISTCKIVKLLKKSNYLLYPILHYLKIYKIKMEMK